MKLYHSTTSPYVRKVMVSAIELGLADRIETVPAKVSPIVRTSPVIADNPLGKLPTLIADDGMILFDSRVISEHLDALAGGGRLIPAAGPARWQALDRSGARRRHVGCRAARALRDVAAGRRNCCGRNGATASTTRW